VDEMEIFSSLILCPMLCSVTACCEEAKAQRSTIKRVSAGGRAWAPTKKEKEAVPLLPPKSYLFLFETGAVAQEHELAVGETGKAWALGVDRQEELLRGLGELWKTA
jgi:hypothetical protein